MFLDKDLSQNKWHPGDGLTAPGPGSTVSGGDSFNQSPRPYKTDVTQIGKARIRSRADINVEQAVQNFIDLWCRKCPLSTTLMSDDPRPLCPKELLDTCPIWIRYQDFKQKKEEFFNGFTIRSTD